MYYLIFICGSRYLKTCPGKLVWMTHWLHVGLSFRHWTGVSKSAFIAWAIRVDIYHQKNLLQITPSIQLWGRPNDGKQSFFNSSVGHLVECAQSSVTMDDHRFLCVVEYTWGISLQLVHVKAFDVHNLSTSMFAASEMHCHNLRLYNRSLCAAWGRYRGYTLYDLGEWLGVLLLDDKTAEKVLSKRLAVRSNSISRLMYKYCWLYLDVNP